MDGLAKRLGREDPLLSRRLIFSINAGRSGSSYLNKLMGTAKNVTSFHEPYPAMAGRYVPSFRKPLTSLKQRLIYPAIRVKKYHKVVGVKEILQTMPADHVYAESNHMFILSFYDIVLDHFKNVQVINLRRYLPRVLKSYVELGHYTPGHDLTFFWAVSPNNRTAAVRALAPDKDLDQVDICIAYLIDIEARAQRFLKEYPHIKVVDARLESLNDPEYVHSFFGKLGLEPTEETDAVLGKVVYQRTKEKEDYPEVTEEYCEERILQYIQRCKEKGIEIPELPQLEKA